MTVRSIEGDREKRARLSRRPLLFSQKKGGWEERECLVTNIRVKV